jgi:outer membrane immunogenic protein
MEFRKIAALGCLAVAGLLAAGSARASGFTGFYVGANVGTALGRSNASTTTIDPPGGYFLATDVTAIATAGAQHLNSTNFTGSGHAGFDIQAGSLVLGVEGDFGYLGLNEQTSQTTVYPCCAPTTFTISQSMKSSWELGVRPRAGLAFGRLLVYGTGGMAATDLNYQEVFTDTYASALETGGVKKTAVGWTAGGGVELRLAHRLSARAEYLYDNFGRVSTTSTNLVITTPPASYPENVFTHSAKDRVHIVQFGLDYRF